jgi:hypothetical protein
MSDKPKLSDLLEAVGDVVNETVGCVWVILVLVFAIALLANFVMSHH